MASTTSADHEREHRLIEQLELRLATASTDEKFETLIQKFLPALILKLASESERNRNLAIKVCQHVSQRVKLSPSIQPPVPGLLKNLKDSPNAFVRRFSLLFLQQAFSRVEPDKSIDLLPEVLQFSIPEDAAFDSTSRKLWSIAFDFLLDALRSWKAPERGSAADAKLQENFQLTSRQCDLLAAEICKFLLYDPKSPATGQALDEDFQPVYLKQFRQRSQVAPRMGDFLFSAIFIDEQRLIPATIMATDANTSVNTISDTMFKQCNFNLESAVAVKALFDLYDTGRPKLQTRVLSLLTKSKTSTTQRERIYSMLEKQLGSNNSNLEAAKLRSALFTYLTWAVRVDEGIEAISLKTQGLLKDYIESRGWPTMHEHTSADLELRSKAYESIGLLVGKRSQAQPSLDLLVWLFTSLRCDTTPDVRSSIEEALGRVMNFIPVTNETLIGRLRGFLLWNAVAEVGDEDPVYYFPTVNSTKYIATRFANKCLPFNDPVARLISVVALASTGRRELAEEGARGLDPYWHAANLRMTAGIGESTSLSMPDLDALAATLFGREKQGNLEIVSSSAYIAAALSFCRNVLVTTALADRPDAITDYADWKSKSDAVIANDRLAREHVRHYVKNLSRSTTDHLLNQAVNGLSLNSGDCADIAVEMLSLSSNEVLSNIGPSLQDRIRQSLTHAMVQTRSARCLAILTSLQSDSGALIEHEVEQCSDWATAVGTKAIEIRGHLLGASFLASRVSLRGGEGTSSSVVHRLVALLHEILLKNHDLSLMNASIQCLAQLALCLNPRADVALGSDAVFDKLITEAKKENDQAAVALGRMFGYSISSWDQQRVATVIDRIVKLHEVKKAEFQLALGESLVVAVAGFRSQSLLTELDVNVAPPTWGYHEELLGDILDRSIEGCNSTKPALKKASAMWLLSFVQFVGDLPQVKTRLRACQTAFAGLLNNRDEIVQETASRGLGIVYEHGDKALRDDLVRDLVQSFTGSNAKMSGSVNEETQLFEAGALPTEGGQSVTTYKDIVSLATEMGDPSLVYKFMNMASNNVLWSSRAAFGRFGLSTILADSSYLAENKKFYPKLFRYRFDPNPNVQRSMNDIWRALVKDPNTVIDQNFDLIMDDLLKSVVAGREWRAREASCAAIMDLVQGRDLDKYEKYLDQIWNISFKVLDDVKETVRLAAMKLCRTLVNMLIRNLEVGQGATRRASALLQHAMPFLLKQMEGGSAQEVQQYATISLLEVVKKSPPKSLRPFAPTILETLVTSLSSLENEGINYLHLNADKYGLTTEKLDKMRVSSVNASPVTEAIDSCLESITANTTSAMDGDIAMEGDVQARPPLEDGMRRLEGTFKTAIGLPSRVGLSRVIVTLVVRYHAAFRPYADRFAQLTRKHILDRNATISIAFSTALGYLMRLASEKEIQATSRYAQKLYFESQDLSQRAVAGEILQAISKTSNDIFINYAPTFLPFAFIGRNDTDSEVRERFDSPWKDNIGGSRAVQLYLKEITTLLETYIKSPLWPIKHACCFAVADMVETSDALGQYTEAEAKSVWPLIEEALGGKTWDGKEKVVAAFPKFVKRSQVLWADAKITSLMEKIAVREAKRTNTTYRPSAIEALGEFAQVRQDLDVSTEVMSHFAGLVSEITADDAMDVDEPNGSDTKARVTVIETTIKAVVSCTFKVLPVRADSDGLNAAVKIAQVARTQSNATLNITVFGGIATYLERLSTKRAASNPTAVSETDTEVGSRRSANGADKSHNTSAGTYLPHEHFAEAIIALAFAEGEVHPQTSSENQRKSRADLAVAIAESGICNATSRTRLASYLDTWAASERSRPIQERIQMAKDVFHVTSSGGQQ